MEVYFDYELDENSGLQGTKNFIDEALRSFLMSRYKVLDDEMEKYNNDGEEIYVIVDWKADGITLYDVNVPEHLREKESMFYRKRFGLFYGKNVE